MAQFLSRRGFKKKLIFRLRLQQSEKWRLERLSPTFWNSLHHRYAFLDWIGRKFELKEAEDWHKLTLTDILTNGGARLVFKYKGSLSEILKSVYPWVSSLNLKNFGREQKLEVVNWLTERLRIKTIDEWYRVSAGEIRREISINFLNEYPLVHLLQQGYPNHLWDVPKLLHKRSGSAKSSQRILTRIVEEIFPSSCKICNLTDFC